jgi:hypothetical protein
MTPARGRRGGEGRIRTDGPPACGAGALPLSYIPLSARPAVMPGSGRPRSCRPRDCVWVPPRQVAAAGTRWPGGVRSGGVEPPRLSARASGTRVSTRVPPRARDVEPKPGLEPGPAAYETAALPGELRRQAGAVGGDSPRLQSRPPPGPAPGSRPPRVARPWPGRRDSRAFIRPRGCVEPAVGLEPTASDLQDRRSGLVSYAGVLGVLGGSRTRTPCSGTSTSS